MRARGAPYAGIGDVARAGLPVDECARRLGRFGFVARRLVYVQAALMPLVATWELKAALSRQLWESAVHWGAWRDRVRELRGHEHLIDGHGDGKLGDAFAELACSAGDAELAAGLYGVVLPAYREALRRYVSETNPLVDFPSARLVRHVLLDLDEWADVGEAMLDAPEGAGDAGAAGWREHVAMYVAAAGGVDGTGEERPSFELPAPRSTGEDGGRRVEEFARDDRLTTSVAKRHPFTGGDLADELRAKMWVRSQEMTAAELCATVIAEWEELPYEGVLDLARHCWDETRHSLFGQAALEADGVDLASVPSWVGYAGHTLPFPPAQRYSHLAIATEATAMRHPGGKRGEWEWCRDAAHHPLMTLYQDFDWADEVNHVKYGRRWVTRFACDGDRARAQSLADETVHAREAFYAAAAEKDPGSPG